MGQLRSSIPSGFSNIDIAAFWNAENGSEFHSEYKDIYEIYTSKRSFEEDVGFTGFGTAPIKQEGAPFQYDTATQTFTTRYQMITYGQGFQISQEAKEDNLQFDMMQKFIPALKESLQNTRNAIAANVLNNGFTTTTLTGEGVALLSTAHNVGRGAGNQSNILSTPADMSYTSVLDILTLIMQTKDDRGKPAPLTGERIIVPTALWPVVTAILKTDGAPGTTNNDVNAITAYGGLVTKGIAVNHWLTDQDAWFVKTNARNGLKFYDRLPVSLENVDSMVSASGDTAVRARTRFAVGCSNWRAIAGSPGV
jgi:hypothetical protein